ncbi:hypothetical protein BH11BAC1_BH11BAC1_08990 [soil metagenome]
MTHSVYGLCEYFLLGGGLNALMFIYALMLIKSTTSALIPLAS